MVFQGVMGGEGRGVDVLSSLALHSMYFNHEPCFFAINCAQYLNVTDNFYVNGIPDHTSIDGEFFHPKFTKGKFFKF
jgi:hypothetical protein